MFQFNMLLNLSPSGKLVQIEYALKAVDSGSPSVGIRAADSVILAAFKNFSSKLVDESSISKIEKITKNIGIVYSGLTPDYRVLVKQARKSAQSYELTYSEPISPEQLVIRVAAVMQEYTQSGGVRPFGVSLLVAGWDNNQKRPFLYQCDPSGTYFPWKATALGNNSLKGKSFLEKRYIEDLALEDAISSSILALKESIDGYITESNIEVGVCDKNGFRVLTLDEVKDYLDSP